MSGAEMPRLDAELLLASILGIDRTGVIAHPEAPLGDGQAERYEELVARREAGEPVAYLRGVREFMGLAFGVDARALIPRPETEHLVELAEAEVALRLLAAPRAIGAPLVRLADVGTGSGAIAVALAARLRRRRMLDEVDILATDDDHEALSLARENAVGHAVADRVRFAEADLVPASEPPFDLVLANLPYVRSTAMAALPRPVSFEPRHALDGGRDGLDVIRRLMAQLPSALAAGGTAILEIGADQEDGLRGLTAILPGEWACTIERDLAGLPRIASIVRVAGAPRMEA